MKKIKVEFPENQILFDKKKCPHCKKDLEVKIIQFKDGNSMDEMNTEIKVKKFKK